MTSDEAAKIVGKPVRRRQGTKTNGPLGLIGSCVYLEAGSASTTPGVHSIVNVIVLGTKVTRSQFLTQIGADAPGSVNVPGVGEEAKLISGGLLAVFDHGTALTVQILVDGKPPAKDVVVDLAKTVLSRL